MGALIRLQWTWYPDGFETIEDWRQPPALSTFLLRGAPSEPFPPLEYLVPVNPERHETYVLEGGTGERVFLDLANVHSVDDVVAFTNEWGVLGDVHNTHGADVTRVLGMAAAMRAAIANARAGQGVDLDAMLEKWNLQPELRMRTARLAGDSAPRSFLQPRDLLAFCVAELIQRYSSIQIRACPRCGKLFDIGKVGKPKMYCSAKCKVSMHRKAKRAQEQRTNVVRLRRSSSR